MRGKESESESLLWLSLKEEEKVKKKKNKKSMQSGGDTETEAIVEFFRFFFLSFFGVKGMKSIYDMCESECVIR